MTEIHPILINSFALLGLFLFVHLAMNTIKSLAHYSKFKSFPKTLEQEKFQLVEQENQRLTRKIEQLEKENEQMTLMVLKKLN